MIGEVLLEAGTPVLVFAPLHEIFALKPHSWAMLLALLAAGTVMLFTGSK